MFSFFPGKPPNITLRVISRIEQPFVMFKKQKEGEEALVGNDRFEVILTTLRTCSFPETEGFQKNNNVY